MANLINIDGETGANIIGDDSTPTLSLSNSSTGPGLQTDGFVTTSTATIATADVAALTATTGSGAAAANATVTGLSLLGTSIASGAVLSLKNSSSFVSATTINIGASAANVNGGIRVVLPNGTFGWIPVLGDAALTGTAV